ncbi:cupin domain-containing protein [Angustibacter sp. McL0619]|uniref:cupin domain-containing protein n=1 Tax=Angustibacter sp. McL0619 TaxID=3415676 RepID=UPI003CF14DA9
MDLTIHHGSDAGLSREIRVDISHADVEAMRSLLRAGARTGNEQPGVDVHLDDIVPKPWGLEYRAYVDDFLDVWQLQVDVGHTTSMHNHPRKLTYLVCLAGEGVLSTLTDEFPVRTGDVVRIAKGSFHSTRNASATDRLDLIEVEAPRNKYDLLRLRDGYARARLGYESGSQVGPTRMRRLPYLPYAFMRSGSPCGRYQFDVIAGMDLYYRGLGLAELLVPLGIENLAFDNVHVLSRYASPDRAPQLDSYYLGVRLVD